MLHPCIFKPYLCSIDSVPVVSPGHRRPSLQLEIEFTESLAAVAKFKMTDQTSAESIRRLDYAVMIPDDSRTICAPWYWFDFAGDC